MTTEQSFERLHRELRQVIYLVGANILLNAVNFYLVLRAHP